MLNYKHIFDLVLSRRLGVSLEVNLVPSKICTMNCICFSNKNKEKAIQIIDG